MRHPFTAIGLFAILAFAGTVAGADVLHIGGFVGTANVERVENVASHTLPAWREEAGNYVEIVSTITQTENGDASVVFRLLDSEFPLTLVWQSGAPSLQLTAPGELPEDVETQAPGIAQTLTWRLRIRSLRNPEQRVILETRQPNGSWLKVLEKTMALAGIREWVEEGGSLRIGVAGPVSVENTNVRTLRDGTLLMVK